MKKFLTMCLLAGTVQAAIPFIGNKESHLPNHRVRAGITGLAFGVFALGGSIVTWHSFWDTWKPYPTTALWNGITTVGMGYATTKAVFCTSSCLSYALTGEE